MIENIQAVLSAVLQFIRVELKARIGLFLERAVQALRDRPYTSFSENQQRRAAERWLADGRAELETALHQRLADTFTHQGTKQSVSYDELKLLDDDSLNVLMLRARLVSSVMEKSREALVALEVRLEALKQAGAQINSKAFTPGAIADGFMETLRQLDVPTEVQIQLMETYSDRGAEMLAEFYTDLNNLLIGHNVIPGFKYSVIKTSPSKPKPASQAWPWSQQPGGSGGGPGGGAGDGAGGGPGGGAGGGAGGGPGGGPGTPVATGTGDTKAGMDWAPPWPAVAAGSPIPAQFAQMLDAKLTAMQQALAHLTAETWKPGTLRDTFKLPPPISLSPEQEESIDHIEAVFLDLIRDTRISARFRSELNRLILPLMSLRLSDSELFKDPDNPVRRFIRQLALLGFRDKELPIQEFEHISLVVGRIVSERAQEIESFNSGADALYTIARNEVRLQLEARQKNRKRPPESDEKDRIPDQVVTESHYFVQTALRSMSAGLHLPTIVQHFVLRVLAPWMMAEYQKHGEDSGEVRDSVLFASAFFDLLEPAGDEQNQQRKKQLRQQAIEQMAFEALRSRKEDRQEMVTLLEGMTEYFDELNTDFNAGLLRAQDAESVSFVSYLDDLQAIRASD